MLMEQTFVEEKLHKFHIFLLGTNPNVCGSNCVFQNCPEDVLYEIARNFIGLEFTPQEIITANTSEMNRIYSMFYDETNKINEDHLLAFSMPRDKSPRIPFYYNGMDDTKTFFRNEQIVNRRRSQQPVNVHLLKRILRRLDIPTLLASIVTQIAKFLVLMREFETLKWLDAYVSPVRTFNYSIAVIDACKSGDIDIVEWFLEKSSCKNMVDTLIKAFGIDAALSYGHIPLIEWLGRRGISVSEPFSQETLAYAACLGHFDAIEWAKTHAPGFMITRSFFEVAFGFGSVDLVELLLVKYADAVNDDEVYADDMDEIFTDDESIEIFTDDDFADEMDEIFTDAVSFAAKYGNIAILDWLVVKHPHLFCQSLAVDDLFDTIHYSEFSSLQWFHDHNFLSPESAQQLVFQMINEFEFASPSDRAPFYEFFKSAFPADLDVIFDREICDNLLDSGFMNDLWRLTDYGFQIKVSNSLVQNSIAQKNPEICNWIFNAKYTTVIDDLDETFGDDK